MVPMPDGWMAVRVAEVGAVRLGRQRSPEKQSGRFSTPYIRAGNITEQGLDLSDVSEMDFTPSERQLFALREGDVVLAEGSGSASHVGRPAIWRGELPLCCFQNTVIRLRPHAVLSEYAEIVFRHYARSGTFGRAARGIGLLHLGSRRFSEMPFPLSPMAEQARIVAQFGTRMDELTEARESLNSALAATSEQDREILAAAAGGHLIEATEKDAAPKGTAGWETVRLEDVGELTLGKALSQKKGKDLRMRPYLRVANIREDRLDLDEIKEMGFTDAEFERYELRPGDILLTEGGTYLGRPAMYRGELPGLGFQNHLIRFRASPRVDPDFALVIFRHYLHNGDFAPLARGSTGLANLSRSRLAAMLFPLPPLEEQRRIAAEAGRRLDASREQREAIESALERSDHMAQALLAAAVAGTLVSQDPDDEPADQLLARLGPPPPDNESTDLSAMPDAQPKLSASRGAREIEQRSLAPRIHQALSTADGGIPLPELCRAAEVNIDDVGELEALYAILRAEIDRSIRVVGKAEENAVLEAIPDAS